MRIPLVLMVVLIAASVLIDLYIRRDLKSSGVKPSWRKADAAVSVLLWIFLIVVLALPKRAGDSDILPLMWGLFAYLTVYTAKLVYVLFSLSGRLIRIIFKIKTNRHPARWAGFCSGLLVVCIMWWGVAFTRHDIVVERVEFESAKLPQAFDGYRIVQLSDIHTGTWGDDTAFVSSLVDTVNSLNPDLIVFTGDLVNRRTDELWPFITTLSRLKAKDGVLGVLGNHDYGDYVDWASPELRKENNLQLLAAQRGMGWNMLNNARTILRAGNDSIVVAGVENIGDFPFPTYGDLEKAIPSSADSAVNQHDSNFKILLSHNPEHWNNYVSQQTNIDLTLSGHTHAMQVIFKLGGWRWSPAAWRYEQWGGLYSRNNGNGEETRLYVNTGSGEVGLPARLLAAYPEVTLITLLHANGK